MKPTLSSAKARAALLQELEHALRRSSAQGVIFGQTVANVAGISGSDLECLDFLNLEGRVTAGRLAEVTGLTTGAITGVVDRLEKAGLVRRERDESDRRKVFIALVPENVAKIGKYYEHMQRSMMAVFGAYTDAELKLLLRFASQGYTTMLAATELCAMGIAATKREANRNVIRAFDAVAERLGNTRTVCKKYYVHPELVRAYFEGLTPSLPTRALPREFRRKNPPPALRRDEVAVLEFLQRLD